MHSKTILTFAALSAVCLLPATGTFAQTDRMGAATVPPAGSVMDVTQFRESLNEIRDLFRDIRESRTLSLATNDPMLQARYTEDTKHKLHMAQGMLDEVSMNWKRSDLPGTVGNNQVGTENMKRYAAESDDTAFVRNTVWELQGRLQGDKLNGRSAVITDDMMTMIDAAIQRAENPSFRVARAFNRDRLSQRIEFSRREEVTTTAPRTAEVEATTPAAEESVTRIETEETTRVETPAPEPEIATETMTEETTEVAAAPTTTEEITTTSDVRTGAADLPQTGGNPGMLLLLGSSLMGAGVFLRRRKQ